MENHIIPFTDVDEESVRETIYGTFHFYRSGCIWGIYHSDLKFAISGVDSTTRKHVGSTLGMYDGVFKIKTTGGTQGYRLCIPASLVPRYIYEFSRIDQIQQTEIQLFVLKELERLKRKDAVQAFQACVHALRLLGMTDSDISDLITKNSKEEKSR